MTPISKRFILVITSVLIAIVVGLLIEVLLSLQAGWPFGHTQKGHQVGWLGFVVLLSVFGYSYKKRCARKAGWPKGWFRVHQIAGTLAPLFILVHTGPHFHALVPLLALMTMGFVAMTGLVGMFVHRKAVGMLNGTRKTLLSQGLSREAVEEKLFELASDEEMFRIWQTIHVPMVFLFIVLLLAHIGGALYFGGM
ncbi:MAG: hypothetical protein IPN42_14040 [Methylococcaceae bacterium]|nr:hypothetical protein [Methylococcaceae bacterium]